MDDVHRAVNINLEIGSISEDWFSAIFFVINKRKDLKNVGEIEFYSE